MTKKSASVLVMVCSNFLLHHQDFGAEGFTLLLQIPKWRVPFSIAWAARNTGQCTGGHTESDDGRVQNVSERFYCGARLKSSEHVNLPVLGQGVAWSLPKRLGRENMATIYVAYPLISTRVYNDPDDTLTYQV
jgi:hypothetical protein